MTAPPSKSVSRSATPTRRPSTPSRGAPVPRSATPTRRPSSTSGGVSVPRSATPTRRTSTPSNVSSVSAPLSRSSSVSKSGPATTRNPVPSRGSSPTVKSRPWKLLEMPGFSLEAPPNLRTSLPERPVSASRGRPQAPNARSSVECGSNGRPRRQSCSPSRGRAPNSGIHSYGSSVHAQDDMRTRNNPVGKSSPLLGSNFGRPLSGKSLDMAMRHMVSNPFLSYATISFSCILHYQF
ncbi:hypothetical protein MKW94_028627 [Papaver nudicaule]|uniref:Uncharacterized protein n=1 Tax=Papaver nudicaule TaxID=74823 RepID=A0AA41V5X0_PAPNU|nr:hypothetical protein [Papaver nudicaule]